MIDLRKFRGQIKDSINNNTGILLKDFFPKDIIPTYSEILKCFYEENKKESNIPFNKTERSYGNVLINVDTLYLTSHFPSILSKNYFPKMMNYIDEVYRISGVKILVNGPKLCIGPHEVISHEDQWHAFSLQCEGSAKWILSETKDQSTGYIEEFYTEVGDCLFFPKGIWHSIHNEDGPRASIQMNISI